MDPEIWGPPAWKFIHLLTLNYPNKPTFQDKYNYKQFILALQKVLPCDTCANHFQQNIQNSDFNDILQSRESLFEWFVDVHNSVNKQNKKKQWSYNDVYKNLQTSNEPKNNYLRTYKISLVLIFMILIYFLIIKRN